MKFDSSMVTVFLATLAPALALFLAIALDRRKRKHTEKPPQTEKLMRPPGYSLSIRLEKSFDSILDNLFAACFFSAFSAAGFYALAVLLGSKAPAIWLAGGVLFAAPFLAGCLFFTLRSFGRFKEAQNIRLGLRGEQAVAEALGEAGDSGFRAFHDLEDEKVGNIDHVAVGTRGVFLIETKARRRRASRNGQPEHEVMFDGKRLQFPTGWETKPIEQAKRNAAWLANYLGKKTCEPVPVEPLVVLPGWFVRISEKGDFPVKAMNANYLVRFLQSQPESIPPAQVRRIVAALDEKCRTIEF